MASKRVSEGRSVVSDSLRSHGPYSPWNSPGQNTGVGSLSLLIQTVNAGEGLEKREPSHTVGGNVKLYSHYAEQYEGSSKN